MMTNRMRARELQVKLYSFKSLRISETLESVLRRVPSGMSVPSPRSS